MQPSLPTLLQQGPSWVESLFCRGGGDSYSHRGSTFVWFSGRICLALRRAQAGSRALVWAQLYEVDVDIKGLQVDVVVPSPHPWQSLGILVPCGSCTWSLWGYRRWLSLVCLFSLLPGVLSCFLLFTSQHETSSSLTQIAD